MNISIEFLGGAGTVTGSKFLITAGEQRILIDCGLFQGLKELRMKNWEPLSVNPVAINAVILTHAHLDHTGYLPLLVKNGFSGNIFCSAPTKSLAKLILTDSAHLQEEDASFANIAGFSKHTPAEPLYRQRDVDAAMRKVRVVTPHTWTKCVEGIKFRLVPNGHILGSTFVELKIDKKIFVFSGDIGRKKPLLYPSPEIISKADYLVMESTYGDRIHSENRAQPQLSTIINETLRKKGHVIIPSFAVGRVQELLLLLSQLKRQKQIPNVPIFLDSPMGINATEIFCDFPDWHKLKSPDVRALRNVATIVSSQEQSKIIMRSKNPSIIIAGSGMITGGRVLHHLAQHLPEEKNTVLIVGYQASGTRGRLLLDGISEIKIHGEYIPVRARIEEIKALSAHADQKEILDWLKNFKTPPKQTFIVHGEPQAADSLRVKIESNLNWSCKVAKPLEKYLCS